MRRRRGAVMALFSRPPGACGGRASARRPRALADRLRLRVLRCEVVHAIWGPPGGPSSGSRWWVRAGLAAGLVEGQAGVEVGLEVSKDGCNLVRSGSFSHGSLPGSLPVVRFPLRLDQILGAGHAGVFRLLACLLDGVGKSSPTRSCLIWPNAVTIRSDTAGRLRGRDGCVLATDCPEPLPCSRC